MAWPPITHQDVQDAIGVLQAALASLSAVTTDTEQVITGGKSFTDDAAPTYATADVTGQDFELGEPVAGAVLRITAANPGSFGSTISVILDDVPTDPPVGQLTARVAHLPGLDAGLQITVSTPMAQVGSVSLGEMVDVINNTPSVAAYITARAPAGADASAVAIWQTVRLAGGRDPQRVRIDSGVVTSALRVQPAEIDQIPLALRCAPNTVTGIAAINIEHRDGRGNNELGYGVTHFDNDGGGGVANDAIKWSEYGVIDMASPFASAPPLTIRQRRASDEAVTGSVQFGAPDMGAAARSAMLDVVATDDAGCALRLSSPSNEMTGDLLRVLNYDADYFQYPSFRVRPDGAVVTTGAEPADDDLAPGQVAWWYDPTEGAPRVRFKGKDTAGTVFDLSPPV